MTTIAFRDGVLAADSCETTEDESSGTYKNLCVKIFRVRDYIVALQGESSPGMVWLDWFRRTGYEPNALPPRDAFIEADVDFTAVVVFPDGRLYEYDKWCTPMPVNAPFYAIGSGAKAALGAMAHGAGAVAAVEAACVVDPYSSLPVLSEKV